MFIAIVILSCLLTASLTLNGVLVWRTVILAEQLLAYEQAEIARLRIEDHIQHP